VISVRDGSNAHQIATIRRRNSPENAGGTFWGLCNLDYGEPHLVAQSQRRRGRKIKK